MENLKNELLEIVTNRISQDKLSEEIKKCLESVFDNLEDSFNEQGYIKRDGCDYDLYIDDLESFKSILENEEDFKIVDKIVKILKEEYNLANYEFFQEFCKSDYTLEDIAEERGYKLIEDYTRKNGDISYYTLEKF
jgi:hypothetical protein